MSHLLEFSTPQSLLQWDLKPIQCNIEKNYRVDMAAIWGELRQLISADLDLGRGAVRKILQFIRATEHIRRQFYRYRLYLECQHGLSPDPAGYAVLDAYQQEFDAQLDNCLLQLIQQLVHSPKILEKALRSASLQPYSAYLRYMTIAVQQGVRVRLPEGHIEEKFREDHEFLQLARFAVKDFGDTLKDGKAVLRKLKAHQDRDLSRYVHEQLIFSMSGQSFDFVRLFNHMMERVLDDMKLKNNQLPLVYLNEYYELPEAPFRAMRSAVGDAFPMVHRYYTRIAETFFVKDFRVSDIASIYPGPAKKGSWTEWQPWFAGAFKQLGPEVFRLFKTLFRQRRVAHGQESGCFAFDPATGPYICLRASGQLSTFLQQASLFGRGIHYLLAQGQPITVYEPHPVIKGAVDLFFMLNQLDYMESIAIDSEQRLAWRLLRMDTLVSVIFYQEMLTRFFLSALATVSRKQLTTEMLSALFREEYQRLNGPAVAWHEAYDWGWVMPDFVANPHYGYLYGFGSFAGLLAYQQVRDGGCCKGFLDALALGGSENIQDTLSLMGVDIQDSDCWEKGITLMEGYLQELFSE